MVAPTPTAAAWGTCFTSEMADPAIDTATQRPATGLDRGARRLILTAVREITNLGPSEILTYFFRDRFGGFDDYYAAVEQVWSNATGYLVKDAVTSAEVDAEFPANFGRRPNPRVVGAFAFLLAIPEPDFRLATSDSLRALGAMEAASDRITQICRARGTPWTFAPPDGFEYVGDEEVERELIRPALAAINRPEFAGGVRAEFEAARSELAKGTPAALKQAVHEAGCATESAMKVVLARHGVEYQQGDTASPLFNHLEAAGIVPRPMQNLVLVAMTPRNRWGGHGAGATPHEVNPEEAGAVVAGAAGAIAYLAAQLP